MPGFFVSRVFPFFSLLPPFPSFSRDLSPTRSFPLCSLSQKSREERTWETFGPRIPRFFIRVARDTNASLRDRVRLVGDRAKNRAESSLPMTVGRIRV